MRVLIASSHSYELGETPAECFELVRVRNIAAGLHELRNSGPFGAVLADFRTPADESEEGLPGRRCGPNGLVLALAAAASGVSKIGIAVDDEPFLDGLLSAHVERTGHVVHCAHFALNNARMIVISMRSERNVLQDEACSACRGTRVCQSCKNGSGGAICSMCNDTGECSECGRTGRNIVRETDSWQFSWNQVLRDICNV